MKLIKSNIVIIMTILLFITSNNVFAEEKKAIINKKAPNFVLKDSKNKEHQLSDYKGKYVVLEWINFECPFVKKHYNSKNMQKIQKKYTKEGVVWLSICSSKKGKQGQFENTEIENRLQQHKALPTAYLNDIDGKVGRMYNAKTTPHMFIIDTEGILVYNGGIDSIKSIKQKDIVKAKNYVSASLDNLLKGKSIAEQKTTPYGCSVKY